MHDDKPVGEENSKRPTPDPNQSHPIATGIGAAGGGMAGAALGKSIAGGVGAAIGGVAGAIAGSIAAEVLADFTEEARYSLGLGADNRQIELPAHYSWEQLQALSKPQVE
jgi:uncharacterized membrane protein